MGGFRCSFPTPSPPFSPQPKPLFSSSRNPTAPASSAHTAPQTYAEYAIAQPPGGAGATVPTGSEPATGENPSQTLKTGAKSNTIIVSPRQVRGRDGVLGVLVGNPVPGIGWEVHTLHLFTPSSCVYHFSLIPAFIQINISSFIQLVIHLFLPIDTPPFMHLSMGLWVQGALALPARAVTLVRQLSSCPRSLHLLRTSSH